MCRLSGGLRVAGVSGDDDVDVIGRYVPHVDWRASGSEDEFHMTMAGSVIEAEMDLWGKTAAPLTSSSSLILTSSPKTVVLSHRTHRPTVEFHPIIELFTQEWSLTRAPAITTHRCNLTPLPITQRGPMTTLGPTMAVGSMTAVGSTSTFPPTTHL